MISPPTATDEVPQVTQKIAYAYTTAYPKESYMGLYISDLHFYARSWATAKTDTDTRAYHGDDGGASQ